MMIIPSDADDPLFFSPLLLANSGVEKERCIAHSLFCLSGKGSKEWPGSFPPLFSFSMSKDRLTFFLIFLG